MTKEINKINDQFIATRKNIEQKPTDFSRCQQFKRQRS